MARATTGGAPNVIDAPILEIRNVRHVPIVAARSSRARRRRAWERTHLGTNARHAAFPVGAEREVLEPIGRDVRDPDGDDHDRDSCRRGQSRSIECVAVAAPGSPQDHRAVSQEPRHGDVHADCARGGCAAIRTRSQLRHHRKSPARPTRRLPRRLHPLELRRRSAGHHATHSANETDTENDWTPVRFAQVRAITTCRTSGRP
jgi:hypothetical protein